MAHRKGEGMSGTAPASVGKTQYLVPPQGGTPESGWCLKIREEQAINIKDITYTCVTCLLSPMIMCNIFHSALQNTVDPKHHTPNCMGGKVGQAL